MRIFTTVSIACVALAASASIASAQSRVQVGAISCEGGPNVGYVVGSETQLHCVFRAEGRRPEPYIANVQRIGLDLGITEQTGLAWAVFAPTYRVGPGDLAGVYGGVGGNASVGVGGGGNLLWGGSQNSYALQPLSLQGQTGLNVTGGIVGVELHQDGIYPQRRHHRRKR
jgi:hypothetical protein